MSITNTPSAGKTPPPRLATKAPGDLEKKQTEAFKDVYAGFLAQLKGPTVKTEFLSNRRDDDTPPNRSLGVA